MDAELLRLALVNHAIAHGLGYDRAWPLVEELQAANPCGTVRELADTVREAAARASWPSNV